MVGASKKSSYTESDYLLGLKNSDNTLFQRMFHEYYGLMVAIGFKVLEDKELAESIVQDVFVNLWVGRHDADIASLKGYLIVSVRNRCLNEIKRQKNFMRFKKEREKADLSEHIEFQPDNDIMEHIMLVIEELPEQRRKVFKMNRIDGLKYAEIAAELNLSVKTIEAQMSKALSYVRERLVTYRELVTLLLLALFI